MEDREASESFLIIVFDYNDIGYGSLIVGSARDVDSREVRKVLQ